MKAEITPENKAKFFAQYWGQNVLSSDMYGDNGTIYSLTMKEDSLNDKWLLLKPPSSISDEDLKAMGFVFPYSPKSVTIVFAPDNYTHHWKGDNGQYGYLNVSDFDYLRSKGYALPWMDLTIEEMVEAGWIKLIEP